MVVCFQRLGRCSPGQALAIVLGILFLVTFSQAQEAEAPDIVTSYNKTLDALDAGDHETALNLCNAIIEDYGTAQEGMEVFGSVFGHWYYLRGLALMGGEKLHKASADFETCYQSDYEAPEENPNHRPNQFRMHALVQWGNCQMLLEDYAKAREVYQQALSEDVGNRLSYNW